jgi:hypothetical protein
MSLSFVRKLERASKHIEDLCVIQESWLGTGAYTLASQRNAETGRVVVRAKIKSLPPPVFSLALGDAVHALRTALDHLALELAVANHRPQAVPPDAERASEFPIFATYVGNDPGSEVFHRVRKKTGKPAPGSGLHKLQGIHPDAIKAIEGIQPYHRGPTYSEDPLWLIHELDRIDKHRRLSLTACAMGGVGINPDQSGTAYLGQVSFEKMGHSGPVEDGTPVAVFTASPDSHFQLDFSREIALAEPTLPHNVFAVQALTQLRDYVRDRVIPLLKPFL